MIAVAGIVPFLQLTVEEPLQWRIVHQFLLTLKHLLTSQDLERAQTVLIEVVGIHTIDAQRSVAIASPTAAEIQFAENAADAVVAREDESQGVILAVGGIGKSYLSQQGREEGTWSTKAVDAEGVVRAVIVCPLSVVNESWGQCIQLEVTHAVGTDDHRSVLLVKGFDH